MKKLLTLAFLLLTGASFAQLTPEFEFQLYFEDAAGNKDTITLGYDPLATDTIDTTFGEVNILNQPWGDSALEVRITTEMPNILFNSGGDDWDPAIFHTKKQVVKKYCDTSWIYWPYIYFDVKNAIFPISISFKDTIFENQCIIGTLFNDYEPNAAWDIGPEIYGCCPLKGRNGTLNLYQKSHLNYKSNTGDTIQSYWIRFGDSTLLTLETPITSLKSLILYPNPFVSEFFLPINVSFSNIQLFDIKGKQILFKQEENRIHPLNCDSGIYFLTFEVNNKTYNYKIIKQ